MTRIEEIQKTLDTLLVELRKHGYGLQVSWPDEYGDRQSVTWPFTVTVIDKQKSEEA